MQDKPNSAFISYVPGPTALRLVSKIHTAIYRISAGRLGHRLDGLNILLLNTIGRRSGNHYQTPMPYFRHPEGYLLIASNAGSAFNPGWYHNLINQPKVSIQVRGRVYQANATVLDGDIRHDWWNKLTHLQPRYIGYQQTTERPIPIVLVAIESPIEC